MIDRVLKGGHIIDPAQGIDRVTDVAFAEGKVQAIGDNLPGPARDVMGCIVTPV